MLSHKQNEVLMDSLAECFDEVSARIVTANTKTILLVSPEKPDPDSVSSMFAFREYLRWKADCLGKKFQYQLYAPDALAENTLYEFIQPLGDPAQLIKSHLPQSPIDLCILFDYGDAARTHTDSLATQKTYFIGFDHHPKTKGFPSPGIEIIDEHAPSTTALLYRFFKHEEFPINADVATCLFTGLAADTKRFSNSLTNAEAHATAAELIRLGARHHEIISAMQPRMTLARFRAQLHLLPLIHIDEEKNLGFFWFSRNDLERWRATKKDFLSLRGTLESIEEITTAVVCYELPEGGWYGSIRTKPAAPISAEAIAIGLGGGGHEHEAGFTSHADPEEILKKIQKII
ncbi:MAG: DHH family phosphoesterase [bacterium]|nr:DHH family phosphoesterase [bacterium]